jgi:hypothetical protein
MRAALVLVAMASFAGCYRPAFETCELLCAGAALDCPEGFSCSNGRCAVRNSTCSGDGDGGVDGNGLIEVTVRSRTPDDQPETEATVLFLAPDGSEVLRRDVDAQGEVTASVPAGSSATVLREVVASEWQVTTFVGLWDHAVVTSRFLPDPGMHSVTVTAEAAPGFTTPDYQWLMSCNATRPGTGTTPVVTMMVPNRCTSVDVVGIVTENGSSATTKFATRAAQTGTAIQITASAWQTPTTITWNPMGIPLSTQSWTLPWVSPDLALGMTLTSAVGSGPFSVKVPTGAGVSAQVDLISSGGVESQYFERLASGATSFTRDLSSDRFLAFPNAAVFEGATRTSRWSTTALPGTMTAQEPSVAYLSFGYVHAGQTVSWHVLASNEHIAGAGTGAYAITFPDLPADLPFDFADGDPVSNHEVHVFAVTPGKEHDVMAVLESAQDHLDLFGVPGLDRIARTITP